MGFGHLYGGGGLPTFTPGAGLGTGPTVVVAGTDGWGTLSITPQLTPTGLSLGTLNWALTWPGSKPIVIITPLNSAARLLANQLLVDIASSTTAAAALTILTANVLVAGVPYIFGYQSLGMP